MSIDDSMIFIIISCAIVFSNLETAERTESRHMGPEPTRLMNGTGQSQSRMRYQKYAKPLAKSNATERKLKKY